jgi:hypothetical protein
MALDLVWLLNKAWMLLIGWFWYDKRCRDALDKARIAKEYEQDVKIVEIQKSIIEARASFVTEAQMKSAIKEALEPYKEDQNEIKLLLRGLNDNVQALSRDMAVQNALRSTGHGTQDSTCS